MSTSLATLQPWLRPWARWLVSLAPYAGATSVRVTSARRSSTSQKELYEKYLSGKSAFPAAPPGRSLHEYGLAWDMVTKPYDALWQLGAWWREVGGVWGGDRDPIHFEVS